MDFIDTFEKRCKDLTSEWQINEEYVLYNFHNLYNPKLVKTDNIEYPYYLYFFGESEEQFNPRFKGSDAIFLARGKNLDNWEVWSGEDCWDTTMNCKLWKPILTAGDEDFDNCHAGDPSVVYNESMFYISYSAVGFSYIKEIDKYIIINNVMGAKSNDGIHWEKSKTPLLIWEKEYEQRWIAGEPMPKGTGSYHRPSLMFDDGKWKMWFDYYLPGTFLSMGYAENEGEFLKQDDWKIISCNYNPQLKDWPNPTVVKAGDIYYSFCDAPGFDTKTGPHRQIVMASSKDGINWMIEGRIIPCPGYGTHVPEAAVLEEEGGYWLCVFYSWQDENCFPNYTKINYMKKFIEK
jgi:hypothetical protein